MSDSTFSVGADKSWLKAKPEPLACYDCLLRYGGPGWMDAVVPDDVWLQISPTGTGGGILCISCMARRCEAKGIQTGVYLGSGPFSDAGHGGATSGPYPKRAALRSLKELVCAAVGWPSIWQATDGGWWAERPSENADYIRVQPLAELLISRASPRPAVAPDESER